MDNTKCTKCRNITGQKRIARWVCGIRYSYHQNRNDIDKPGILLHLNKKNVSNKHTAEELLGKGCRAPKPMRWFRKYSTGKAQRQLWVALSIHKKGLLFQIKRDPLWGDMHSSWKEIKIRGHSSLNIWSTLMVDRKNSAARRPQRSTRSGWTAPIRCHERRGGSGLSNTIRAALDAVRNHRKW